MGFKKPYSFADFELYAKPPHRTVINLKALNRAEGPVQRFRAMRATTKQVTSYKVCEKVILGYF